MSLRRMPACLAAAGIAACAAAADLHVAPTGSDAADGLTWPTALARVTSALDAAALTPEADMVRVAAGTYLERIVVPPDVTLLGGFPAGGGAQDPVANPTILDGERRGPVMQLGAGTDACVVDGFTIRNGLASGMTTGGGVTIIDASPAVRRCTIERNRAIRGGGVYSSGGAPLLEDCVVRDNVAMPRGSSRLLAEGMGAAVYAEAPWGDPRAIRLVRCRFEDNVGTPNSGNGTGGVFYFFTMENPVADPIETELEPLMDDCLVRRNAAVRTLARDFLERGEGAVLWLVDSNRASRIRGTLFRGNSLMAVAADYQRQRPEFDTFENCEFSGQARAVVSLRCAMRLDFENCTFAGNPALVNPEANSFPNQWSHCNLHRCVVADPLKLIPRTCNQDEDIRIYDSLTADPWTLGSNIVVGNASFATAPAGPYALAQAAAGQAADSLGVDGGPETAAGVGLDGHSTRSDEVPDAGIVDWGVHYNTVWPELPGQVPDTAVEILRGTHPLELTRLAIVPALPFTDAPGRLSEPGLWFYLARWPWQDVFVIKARGADTVVLSH